MGYPDSDFKDHVLDLLASLEGASARKMFGGYGVYAEGVMFGLIADSTFYLKVDADNVADFENAGSEPFLYQHKSRSKPTRMSYYRAPEDAMDHSEELLRWADSALAAAKRAKSKR